MKYNLSIPHLTEDKRELKYVTEAIENNNIGPVGHFIPDFENAVKKVTGANHAIGVVNGTAAIHLALLALGIEKGDAVLASTFTFIGSVEPVCYCGAEPIFIDSEADTWNMDANLLEDELKQRSESGAKMPKALVLTHLYGQPADMDSILFVCARYGVTVIEDAAEAMGSTYRDRHAGTFGKMGIYSFNGNKMVTAGGGGILVSDDKKMIDKAAYFATQAREPVMHYEHLNIGYNYRLSNLHAAVGLAQMEVLKNRMDARRRVFSNYKKNFAESENIEMMPETEYTHSNCWLSCALFRGVETSKLMVRLANAGVETRPLWKPMHLQPVFKDAAKRVNGTSERLFKTGLCLPSCSTMTDRDVDDVSAIIQGNIDIMRDA